MHSSPSQVYASAPCCQRPRDTWATRRRQPRQRRTVADILRRACGQLNLKSWSRWVVDRPCVMVRSTGVENRGELWMKRISFTSMIASRVGRKPRVCLGSGRRATVQHGRQGPGDHPDALPRAVRGRSAHDPRPVGQVPLAVPFGRVAGSGSIKVIPYVFGMILRHECYQF